MTEPTALFLASLSHRWAPIAVPLPFVFGAVTYASGVFLARSRANPNIRVWRLALAARIFAFNLLAVSLLVFLISITHFDCAVGKAESVQCMSNLKVLGMATLMYAQDNDDRLPPANHWSEAIAGSVANSERASDYQTLNDPRHLHDPFHCPSAESSASYGINAAAAGRSITEGIDSLGETVLLFDADAPTRSFVGGAQNLARSRHLGSPIVAFADGHVHWLNIYTARALTWDPASAKPLVSAVP